MKNAGPFIWDDERAGKILDYKVLAGKVLAVIGKKVTANEDKIYKSCR